MIFDFRGDNIDLESSYKYGMSFSEEGSIFVGFLIALLVFKQTALVNIGYLVESDHIIAMTKILLTAIYSIQS